VCILLVAYRRGHIPEGETPSITQLEYAIADGLKAVDLEPTEPEYRAGLGQCYAQGGREEEAYSAYREAVRLQPDNSENVFLAGWYAYRTGRLAEAIEASRRATELRTDHPMSFFNLGLALIASGETAAALREYAIGVGICPRQTAEEAHAEISRAAGDLDDLASRRAELRPEIGRARETLQRGLKSASG